jgi:CoA:oxalate CoA-transferase
MQPRIVYCSISGYGQHGPHRDWPAIDNIVQATSGMMTLGGVAGDAPTRVGFPIVDTLTGQTAAFAILAALLRRERQGKGEYIDVAMFDASMAFMTSAAVPYLVTGRPLERTGNTGYSGQPTSALFRAADGKQISLGVVQQSQFEALARELNHTQWLVDPRFTTPDLRRQNGGALQAELSAIFSTQPAEHWEQRLSTAGIPCGMVRNVAEAISLPHVRERNLRLPLTIPGLPGNEQVEIVNAGFQFESDGPGVSESPPFVGQHTQEILESLGFNTDQRLKIMDEAG